jgi:hypothetical protein
MGLNLDLVNLPPFKLNIQHVGPHLLKWSLSSHVSESVKVIVK